MHKFKDLIAWQKSRVLEKDIYEVTKKILKEEIYGITSQIRRAAVSVPTNVSEGAGRRRNPQFLHFLDIVLGSAIEVENLLIISNDLEFTEESIQQKLEAKCIEIQKLIYGLMSKLSPQK